ncbi:MAG: chemotaxis protein CheA [Bacteroidales bacterium]|nr:chemotaxis protein CheA [Bacteroidales bacterium]
MDQFIQKFIEEASDLINELEEVSLLLEKDTSNKEIVERIFRIMHTIKGSAGMFGFSKIDEFTHQLETIYDLVRTDKMTIFPDILDITFSSVDHLKLLLFNQNKYSKKILNQHQNLLDKILAISSLSDITTEIYSDNLKTPVNSEEEKTIHTYYIYFEPASDILQNGTNPLYLIDELNDIGTAKTFCRTNKIPEINKIKPEKSYVAWELFIATNMGINSIIDVFMFVEEDSKLVVKKISKKNLLEEPAFEGILNKAIKHEEKVDVDQLMELIHELEFLFDGGLEEEKIIISDKTEEDKQITSIRVSSEKLDELMNLVSELVTMQVRLNLIADNHQTPELTEAAEDINKLSHQLSDNAFSLTLLPIETMLTRFQRLVRDLSKEMGKEIIFEIEGADTELDKSIIQNLIDPVLHIFRNSIDHGIEDPEIRIKKGKPRQGKILLKSYYSGANVIIQVEDDGKGIDPEVIINSAIKKGIISKNANLSKREKLNLIFLPGFSTADNVSDISGRGVGMDVVRRKLADLHGEVEVESELGKGSTITLKIPLTLSILDGLLVEIDDVKYLIPLTVIDKIYAVEHSKLVNTFNNQIILDGEKIPFYYLREEFGLDESTKKTEQVLVIKYNTTRIGLAIDNVIGEFQAVLKPLGKLYREQDIFSGATILGDGTVALILDTHKIIKTFSNQTIYSKQ